MRDVGGNRQIAAAMVGSAVENQQDVLPGELSRQRLEEGLEARGVRHRHDQIDAAAVLDCAVQSTSIAAAMAGCVIPLSRESTI